MKPILKTILIVAIFSIAMGYMESVIVVYLRCLYYPTGFKFPMKTIDHGNGVAEFWRELATLVMLYTVGYLAGKNKPERFAFFIFSFAIWDIFYYVFLKALINWPDSLLTWDILFLIPLPWIGPVLATCIVSLSMIVIAMLIIYFNELGNDAKMLKRERLLIIIGCFVIIGSFVKDYIQNLNHNHDMRIWTPLSQNQLFADFMTFVPVSYSWWLFGIGEAFIVAEGLLYFSRQKRKFMLKMAKIAA